MDVPGILPVASLIARGLAPSQRPNPSLEGFKMIGCIRAVVFLVAIYAEVAFAAGIDGTYRLVKDSDGNAPKNQAVVTITFQGVNAGNVSMRAVQPGETVTDSGSFWIGGQVITIQFAEMVWQTFSQSFTLEGCNLTLPFKALGGSEGAGTSLWVKETAACGSTGPQKTFDPQSGSVSDIPVSHGQAAETNAAHQSKPNPTAGKLKACNCRNIEDLARAARDNAYLQGRFKKQAETYKKQLEDYKNFGRTPSPIVLSRQFDDYNSWRRGQLRNEFSKDMGYNASMTVTPDPNNQRQIDPKALKQFTKQAACQGLVDDVIAHENYHIKVTAELQAGTRAMNTAADLAQEEVEAYEAGQQAIKPILDKLKSECKWKCIDKKPTPTPYYDDKASCERACRGGLAETIRLDPKRGRCDLVKTPP